MATVKEGLPSNVIYILTIRCHCRYTPRCLVAQHAAATQHSYSYQRLNNLKAKSDKKAIRQNLGIILD